MASTYAVHLAFSGGVKATIDTVQPDPSSVCRTGEIDVVLIVQGETWSLKVSVDSYRGPGTYASPSFSVFIATSNNDLWLSTSGSGAYASDTALSLNVVITNMMAGPGEPGSSAHVTGSITCT